MLYDYECEDCHYFMMDVYQSIHDDAFTVCPQCGAEKLERIISGGLGAFVKDVKTIGQLADRNWNKMGTYEKSEKVAKTKTDAPTFYGGATKTEINKMSETQKQKYIITGET